jgi:hypothetical protein
VNKTKNLYGINFDAPDAHFDKVCLHNDAWVEKFGNPKQCYTRNQDLKKKLTKTECHKLEPNPSKDRAMHGVDDPLF